MTRQYRIALTTYALHRGGMEAFILRLGGFLRAEGHDVTVVTTVTPGEWFGRAGESGLRGVHLAPDAPSGWFAPLRHAWDVGRWLARGGFDVVLLNHDRYGQAGLGLVPDRVAVLPILHNDDDSVYRVGCANRRAWNAMVAVGPRVAAEARRRVPDRPVREIRYGVDLPTESEMAARRGAPDGTLEVVYSGRLDDRQKRVLMLPDIVARARDLGLSLKLTVVGDGPDRDALQRAIGERGLAEVIALVGARDPDEVYKHYRDAHVLLLPSRFEGFPTAPLEAQSCGCVPILSLLPGITDAMVGEGASGILVDPGDTDGFAHALRRMADDPSAWRRMSEAGQRLIRERYSVPAMGRAYLELFEEAMRGALPLVRSRRWTLPALPSLFNPKEMVPRAVRDSLRGRAQNR